MMHAACADGDLRAIAADAGFLWERLSTDRFIVANGGADAADIERRLERWREIVARGDAEALQRRLDWDGVQLEAIRPYLGRVRLAPDQPLPRWADTLQRVMQAAAAFDPASEAVLAVDANAPVPFEGVLLPAVAAARRQLLDRFGSGQLAEDRPPLSLLSEAAYAALERALLRRLASVCAKTLHHDFSQTLPFGRTLVNILGLGPETSGDTEFRRFVGDLLRDGLRGFFRRYPVLGRLVATVIDLWVESTAEFLDRLARDMPDLQLRFGRAAPLGKVVEVQTSLSDPHKGGRSVSIVTFAAGLRLVYKPKDLGLEVAFNRFLAWCNAHAAPLDFKVIDILDRHDYGWVEFVEHRPCADEAAAERFYVRAGMLLCVLYVLRGTDCHYENLIASGEHWVLIDGETLLQHEGNPLDDSPLQQEAEGGAIRFFSNSVLRIGLLPRWEFSVDRRSAYDISALGSTEQLAILRPAQRWHAINSDDMHLRSAPGDPAAQTNLPRLGDRILSANDYQAQFVQGFAEMYRFLVTHKEALLARDGPLAAFSDQQVRFLARATRVYDSILRTARAPDFLRSGADYSIELDRLSRAYLLARETPKAWPMLHAELRAVEQLDIPFFTASSSETDLPLRGEPPVPQYFREPTFNQAVDLMRALDEADLARQTAVIHGAFQAKIARSVSPSADRSRDAPADVPSADQLLETATKIAADLEARALSDPDGGINWIGLGYTPQADRLQLQVLDNSMYDGRCGVALFLAALHKVSGEPRFRDLALRALQSLRRQIRSTDRIARDLMAPVWGIGGASGLGSMTYALVKTGQLLADGTLVEDAEALVEWIAPELIATDDKLDVIAGAAGTILGLMTLYDVSGHCGALEKAHAAGQHLLQHRAVVDGHTAWRTIDQRPLTGFAHGAAGISYALLRLHAATGDTTYRDAALDGIAYESSLFSEAEGNWPDLRGFEPDGQPSFPVQWCYGAPGVALARLASLAVLDRPDIRRDIEVSVHTTKAHGVGGVDHVCCGTFGRVETLLVAGQRCARTEWREHALRNAAAVVDRARRAGAYELVANLPSGVFNPGFFQGTSGIGYGLLRLADERLPSVLLWE